MSKKPHYLVILFFMILAYQNCAPFEVSQKSVVYSSGQLEVDRFNAAKAVIQKNCASCHYAGAPGGTLLFNSEAEYINSNLVTAGSVSTSKIITRLRNYPTEIAGRNMPPTGPIADADYATLTSWISSMSVPQANNAFTCSPDEPASTLDARRLSKTELLRSLQRILERAFGATEANQILTGSASTFMSRIPNDNRTPYSRSDRSFESNHADAYFNLAEELANSMTNTVRYSRLVTTYVNYAPGACTSLNVNTLSSACRDAFINNFLLRLWGRPLESGSNELVAYQSEFERGLNSVQSVNNFLFRALLSPQFLHHVYTDVTPTSGNTATLSSFAVARRLSYHFQLAGPDEQLLQMALSSNLAEDPSYTLAVNLVSQSPTPMIQDFVDDWLKLYRVSSIATPNTAKWARVSSGITFDSNLRTAMRQELIDFTTYLYQAGRPVQELLTSNVSTARQSELMKVYGVTTPAPSSFNESTAVRLPANERSGILTRAGYLYNSGESERPVVRGLHVMNDILCTEVKGTVPPAAAMTALPTGLFTTREKYDHATSGSSCIGCHGQINPIGNAFAKYNSFGGYQLSEPIFVDGVYRQDLPVNSRVNLQVPLQTNEEVEDGVAFSEWIAKSTHFQSCLTKKYQTYTQRLATTPSTTSSCDMQRMSEIIKNNGSLSDFLRAPASNSKFRARTLVR